MKTKNMREMEKYWAEREKKAAKKSTQPKAAPKKKRRKDVNQAALGSVQEATEKK
jgi:Tfp pilus assembly protein PilE